VSGVGGSEDLRQPFPIARATQRMMARRGIIWSSGRLGICSRGHLIIWSSGCNALYAGRCPASCRRRWKRAYYSIRSTTLRRSMCLMLWPKTLEPLRITKSRCHEDHSTRFDPERSLRVLRGFV